MEIHQLVLRLFETATPLHRYTLLLLVFTPPLAVYAALVVNATLVTAATLRNSSHATVLFC